MTHERWSSRRAHEETQRDLHCIKEMLRTIHKELHIMAGEIDRVVSETAEIKGTIDSAVAMIESLAQLIRDNIGNAAKLNQIADDLDASGNKLAAAVVAGDPNTPPAPLAEPAA